MNAQAEGNRIRLLLVDAPGLYRASLGRFLASEPGVELVGECGTPGEALHLLIDCQPDVVLADLDGCIEPESDLITATRQAGYSGHFLIVCGGLDAPKAAMALRLGALGIFLRAEPPELLGCRQNGLPGLPDPHARLAEQALHDKPLLSGPLCTANTASLPTPISWQGERPQSRDMLASTTRKLICGPGRPVGGLAGFF
jgi:hypothetical protein